MINTAQFTKFDRTQAELEELLMFSIAVAGKRAETIAKSLDRFIHSIMPAGYTAPLEAVRCMFSDSDALADYIERYNYKNTGLGLGQPSRLARAFWGAAHIADLRTCTLHELMAIHGIGPKTARMFLLHSRPDQKYAVLDTHMLKYLIDAGYPNIPEQTPQSASRYAEIGAYVLEEADKHGMSTADFDLMVWRAYAQGPQEIQGDHYTIDEPYVDDGHIWAAVHFNRPSYGKYAYVAKIEWNTWALTAWHHYNENTGKHGGKVETLWVLRLHGQELINTIRKRIIVNTPAQSMFESEEE